MYSVCICSWWWNGNICIYFVSSVVFVDFLIKSSLQNKRLLADDCLLYREINNRQDGNALQNDLNLLENWDSKWGMRFNAAKCNIMRMSRGSL